MAPRRRLAIALAVSVLLAGTTGGCDFGLWGPSGSGVIRIRIQSPYGAEGAALLELSGGVGLGPVTIDSGQAFFQHGADTSRIVVVLDEPGEIHFLVRSEDIGTLPHVTLLEVADGSNHLRESLTGYKVKFQRIEDLTSDLQRRSP
jgi:hypothetical protein